MGDTLKVIITIVIIIVAICIIAEGMETKIFGVPLGIGVVLLLRAIWKND